MKLLSLLTAAVVARQQNRDPLKHLLADEGAFTQLWHTNLLDHFDDSNTFTYQQRYWSNDDYFDKNDGPIFLYLCGEWTCSPPSVDGAAFKLGASLNAKLMVLEHRYYGDSQPIKGEEAWSYENLQFLNTTQALADVANFIDQTNS